MLKAGGEAVMQNYGVKTLNRDGYPLEKKGDVSSWTVAEIIRPNSRRKSMAESLISPRVSTAIGWSAGRSAYLASFLEAAGSAAAAAVTEEAGR